MGNINQIYYSPDDSGGGKNEEEKELLKIKEQVVSINPREPNYEGIGLGIEITTKGFQGKNIDHHGEKDTAETPSAIEQVVSLDVKDIPEGKMATVRPDLDSCGAMAVLLLKKEGEEFDTKLVKAIGLLDRMGPAGFKEKAKELLNLSDEEFGKIDKSLRAANYKILVERMPIEQSVLFMKKLLTGKIDAKEIEEIYEKDKKDLEEAEKNSQIEVFADNKAVFIESTAKRSMEIGYQYADVIIAYNPNFKWPDGTVTSKYTIARRDKFVPFDLAKLKLELQKLNPKWGGQENIIGSPQGEVHQISPEEMKKLVEKYIIKEKDISKDNIIQNKEKEEQSTVKFLKFLDDVMKQISKLKIASFESDSPQYLDYYTKFVFNLSEFLNVLNNYQDNIKEIEKENDNFREKTYDSSLETRNQDISNLESLDKARQYEHDRLMDYYINLIYYYQKVFNKNNFPLESFLLRDNKYFDSKYIKGFDKRSGNVEIDFEEIPAELRNQISAYFIQILNNINQSEDSRTEFESFRQYFEQSLNTLLRIQQTEK